MIKIWVEDTGRGVSPEDQAKVFDAFESRGPSAGAGLGLSLVDRFARLHGGWTRLESTEGKGARVTCCLPEVAPENQAVPESKDAKAASNPVKKATAAKKKRKGKARQTARAHAAE